MSQNDLVIANQTFPATRADITSALQALGSTNSGPSAPSTTYANMMWYDTTSHILKLRAEANDVWINIGYVDQSSDTFKILDDTIVATTAGATTGLLGDQATGVWQAGTGTTESLVSPAKVRSTAYPSQSLNSVGHLQMGNVLQQWGRISVIGSENQDFSVTFDTTFSSSPWSIVTTVESDKGGTFDLFEAYIRTRTSSGFVGRFGASASHTYSDVFVNYMAIGPA